MKLLITGGTGFLGKHVANVLQESSFFNPNDAWIPSSRDLNLLSQENLFWSTVDPDIILHMAAKCGGILANKNSPATFIQQNIEMGSNIYTFAKLKKNSRDRHKKPAPLVYTLGSVCAYPKFCPAPFKEDDIWNGYPEETNAPYGIAKRTLMVLGQAYRQEFGIGGAHLIPVNLYGEYDHFDLTNSHVIPALIRKFDNAVVNRLPTVECWGTGEATREFLYAGDAAEAIVHAMECKLDTDLPINLGTGKDISIKDLASLIGDLMEYNGKIVFTGEVSDGQPKRVLDVTRAKKMLGWTARTNFEEGLIRTIEWYKKNKRKIIAEECDAVAF